jgi:hypothetical protein
MNLRGYKGFQFMKGDTSWECQMINIVCTLRQIPVIYVNKDDKYSGEYIPSGSVEWCLSLLDNKNIIPDYYPEWLSDYLYRNVWKTDKWPLGKEVFIKPADMYKRFTGLNTYGSTLVKENPPFICSDIVEFTNEWRYYISYGKVLCGEWYQGDEINTPDAPILDIEIPDYFCGTLDFGTLNTGEFALIEAHHPFACGWYGKNHELYAQWCIDGWDYMIKRI